MGGQEIIYESTSQKIFSQGSSLLDSRSFFVWCIKAIYNFKEVDRACKAILESHSEEKSASGHLTVEVRHKTWNIPRISSLMAKACRETPETAKNGSVRIFVWDWSKP